MDAKNQERSAPNSSRAETRAMTRELPALTGLQQYAVDYIISPPPPPLPPLLPLLLLPPLVLVGLAGGIPAEMISNSTSDSSSALLAITASTSVVEKSKPLR